MNSPHRNRNENMVMKENIFRPTVEKVLADIQIIIITICNDIYIYISSTRAGIHLYQYQIVWV